MLDLGIRAIEYAVRAAEEYNRKAEERDLQDVQRVQNYLLATQAAIVGLEREYDQILVQAKHCDLTQTDQVEKLSLRIDEYLKVDNLRPELMKAVVGLGECRLELERNTERFSQWPWTDKNNRREAIANFAILITKLEKYITELEEQGLKYRPAGTGVAVSSLMQIIKYLTSNQLVYNGKSEDLSQIVGRIQEDRTKDNLKRFTVEIQLTIDELFAAFR